MWKNLMSYFVGQLHSLQSRESMEAMFWAFATKTLLKEGFQLNKSEIWSSVIRELLTKTSLLVFNIVTLID